MVLTFPFFIFGVGLTVPLGGKHMGKFTTLVMRHVINKLLKNESFGYVMLAPISTLCFVATTC